MWIENNEFESNSILIQLKVEMCLQFGFCLVIRFEGQIWFDTMPQSAPNGAII